MESTLTTYVKGSIVRYVSPFHDDGPNASVAAGIPASHPMLILNSNAGESESSCQCMMLSSKLSRYYGYRIYLNTMDRGYQGLSVICCTKVFTIEKKFLHDIIGFAPDHLVQKCLEAYGWVLGVTDVIPDFYANDPICMQYACGVSVNSPATPASRYGVNTGSPLADYAVYSSRPRGSYPKDIWKLKSHFAPNLASPEDVERVQAYFVEDDPVDTTDQVTIINPPTDGDSDDKSMEVNPPSELVYVLGYNLTMEDRTAEYLEYPSVPSGSKAILDTYAKLSQEEKYLIYTRLKPTTELLVKAYGVSQPTANRVAKLVRKTIAEERMALVEAIKTQTINVDRIVFNSKYHLAFRCMTVKDLDECKLSVVKYSQLIKAIDESISK